MDRSSYFWIGIAFPIAALCVTFRKILTDNFEWQEAYDDPQNIVDNIHIHNHNLSWIWLDIHNEGEYTPITQMARSALYGLMGPECYGFIAAGLLCHVCTVLLGCYAAFRRVKAFWTDSTFDVPIILWCSMLFVLFGIHPLRAEVLGWVSADGYLLAGLFVVLTVYFWVPAFGAPAQARSLRYMISLLCYVCACASQPSAVPLAAVLLSFDLLFPVDSTKSWRQRLWKHVSHHLPYLFVGFAFSILTFWITLQQAHSWSGFWSSFDRFPLVGEQFCQAIRALGHVLEKSLWPQNISPMYPIAVPILQGEALVLVCMYSVVLVGIAVAWWMQPNHIVFRCTAWCMICIISFLFPTFVLPPYRGYPSLPYDRYVYLPHLVIALFLPAIIYGRRDTSSLQPHVQRGGNNKPVELYRSLDQLPMGQRLLSLGVFCIYVSHYALCTTRAIGCWESSNRLWSHAVYDSKVGLGFVFYGSSLHRQGKYEEARDVLRAAILCGSSVDNIGQVSITKNLVVALHGRERVVDSDCAYNFQGITQPLTYKQLGNMLYSWEMYEEATAAFRTVTWIDPLDMEAQRKLGDIFIKLGQTAKALPHLEVVYDNNPNDLNETYTLASTYQELGLHTDRVVTMYQRIVHDRPNDYRTWNMMAMALLKRQDYEQARQAIDEVLEALPDDLQAHLTRAVLSLEEQSLEVATEEMTWLQDYIEIAKSNPQSFNLRRLQRILAALRYFISTDTTPKHDPFV